MRDRKAAVGRLVALALGGILAFSLLCSPSTPASADGKGHDKGGRHSRPMKIIVLPTVKTHDRHR